MNDRSSQSGGFLNIAGVERDTGLSKDTLRVWERRYGFPTPVRDRFGERAYSPEQVSRLRTICRLIDAGHRPGKLVALPDDRLHALASEADILSRPAAPSQHEALARLVGLIGRHETDLLRQALSQTLLKSGLERFVIDVVAPLNRLVGEAWACGAIEVFEEHLYTESVQAVLRGAIGAIVQPGVAPSVLLTTFPQEGHGLGLLMAEALLALEGCRCVSLGVQTPIGDIARAADAQRVDVVGLSFSSCMKPHPVLDGLAELRALLPEPVRIWAGGRCPVLGRRQPPGVTVMTELSDIRPALKAWRGAMI